MMMNNLDYKIFCTQNIEEVVRDHDNKGYINFAVDFDGVLCECAYPKMGRPNRAMIDYLIKQRQKGNKVILWTARTDVELQEAVDWCKERGLEFDHVNEGDPVVEKMYGKPGCPTRKIYADVYIDDRNMAPLNIWPRLLDDAEIVAAHEAKVKEEDVVHKALHYQNGAYEVIDEMILVFGAEAAITFCKINAWKYRARAAYKGKPEEDMNKADEYLKMAHEIMKRRAAAQHPDDSYCLIGDRE